MSSIKVIQTETLTLEKIPHLLPDAGYQQILFENAVIGNQPKHTYVVGTLHQVFPTVIWRGNERKRIIINEVIADGSQGSLISITIFGVNAAEADGLLQYSESSPKKWIVITNSKFMKFAGYKERYISTVCIHIYPEEHDYHIHIVKESLKSNIKSFDNQPGPSALVSPPPTKTSSRNRKYLPLSAYAHQVRGDFIAVISNMPKPVNKTEKGTLYMLLAIVDPSSPIEDGVMRDSLLSVFSLVGECARGYQFLKNIKRGSIIIAKGVKVEDFYSKLFGIIFSLKQISLISGDIDDEITQTTYSSASELSESDEEKIRELRLWSEENFSLIFERLTNANQPELNNVDGEKVSHPEQKNVVDATISEITKENLYFLYCKVVEKIRVETVHGLMWIIRVQDGSKSSVYFREFALDNQNDPFDCILSSSDSATVDITVTKDAIIDKFKKDDFIVLKNLSCKKLSGRSENERIIYELKMLEGSMVLRMRNKWTQMQLISKRIAGKLPQGIKDEVEETQEVLDQQSDSPLEILNQKSNLQTPQKKPINPNTPFLSEEGSSAKALKSPSERQASPDKEQVVASSSKSPPDNDSFVEAVRDINYLSEAGDRQASPDKEQVVASSSKSPPENNSFAEAVRDIHYLSGTRDRPEKSYHCNSQSSTSTKSSRPVIPRKLLDGCQSSPESMSDSEDFGELRLHDLTNDSPEENEMIEIERDRPASQANEKPAKFLSKKELFLHTNLTNDSPEENEMIEIERDRPASQANEKPAKFLPKKELFLHTICSQNVSYMSLKDLLDNRESEEPIISIVPGVVYGIYISSSNPYSREKDSTGFHDWIWGFCEICGHFFENWQLRERFEPEDFMTDKLPCETCHQVCNLSGIFKRKRRTSSDSSPPKKKLCPSKNVQKTQAKPGSSLTCNDADDRVVSVIPFINIALLLGDPLNRAHVRVKLFGKHAETFFGIKPNFTWLTGKMDPNIELLTCNMLHSKTALFYCISYSPRRQTYHIIDTSLKAV